ncbi:MAG: ATP-binding protein [FCB group bacterium]|jgi:two-component system phosphate regulon sensor histidine kinase PhoR
MNKIFTKIFLSYLAVIFIFSASTVYFSFSIIRENYQNTLIHNLINENNSIIYYITPLLKENKYSNLDSLIKNLGREIESRITIINPQGIVIADSKADVKTMDNHSQRPEVMQAKTGGTGTSIRHSYTVDKDMLYVALPIMYGSNLLSISRVSLYMDDVDNLINSLLYRILQIIFVIILLALVFGLLFSQNFTKPIKQMASAAHLISEGNFNIKVNLKNKGELKLLADSFNNMVERIKELFTQSNQKKEELNNIITSIQEGLVVLDNQNKIVLSNQSFNNIVKNGSVIGKFIWEILRDNQVDKFIKKMKESETSLVTEIQYNDEYYLCSANHINQQKEIVIIFYNISELKKLENIKKDFVINVSHELRTPLTVIKGYIETIDETISENEIDENISTEETRKYIDIIKNHTNRLINIVQDLLSITQLEEKSIKINIIEFQLDKFFNNLNNTFEQKLKQKNLYLKININPDISFIKADEFKLEQMFINLIDNAIKYTEEGGIIINIDRDNAHVRFEVIDTGIGIPDKDRDRIFERFYTVDKSRSRQMAGTGLGLSIVKHIVLLHNGKINVESTIGTGSKFIILLPNI